MLTAFIVQINTVTEPDCSQPKNFASSLTSCCGIVYPIYRINDQSFAHAGKTRGDHVLLRRLAVALRRQDWPTVIVEFLLVVLGVLLALQLDNWNEQRKDRALFQDYLVQLQTDLREDIRQAERRIEAASLLDERASYLVSVIEGKAAQPIDHNRLVSAVLTAGYAYLDLVNRQTYDELISTGNLRLFPDTALKREVVSYYANQELGTQWNTLIQSVQIDYRRATRNLLTAEQFRWAREHWRDFSTPTPPMDIQRFMRHVSENENLLGVINAMAEIQQRTRDDSRSTAEYARRLLERLEAYKRGQE